MAIYIFKHLAYWTVKKKTKKTHTFGSKVALVQGLVCNKQKLTVSCRLERCGEMHMVDEDPGEKGLENGQAILKCG